MPLRDLARPRHDVGVGLEALGSADDDVHAGGGAGEHPRVAHVAGAVADEGDPDPGQPAVVLAHGLQVGEQLAGVELVGERVEHRHAGVRRHGDDVALVGRAPHDRRGLAAEHPGDVLDALARPIAARPPSTVIGLPPSSAMPAANDTWVRRVGRSKTRATVRGPASGLWSNGSAFIRSARSRTSTSSAGDRSSSREEVARSCECGSCARGAGGVEDGGQGRDEGVERRLR